MMVIPTSRNKRICVFAGSSLGAKADYAVAAKSLGRSLVFRDMAVVYGGGDIGLMGILAESVLAEGGEIVGVIPQALLNRDVGHESLTELRVVSSMHERKEQMSEMADGFIVLPGGLGTLEEFFEIVTWAQLGIHHKPVGLMNVAGYYDRLLEFLDVAVFEKFIELNNRNMVLVEEHAEALLDRLEQHIPPAVEEWKDD